jgi:hypothetical protein
MDVCIYIYIRSVMSGFIHIRQTKHHTQSVES